ncbi:MAG: DUF5675 family protein [Ghiorsea sp.]
MLKLTLKRTSSIMSGTFGMLLDEFNAPLCLVAERPDLGNEANISCIPCGEYKVAPHISNHFGGCLMVHGTEPRTRILIHKGNNPMHDSKGCLLVGSKIGWFQGSHAVLNSDEAFKKLMKYVDDKEFTLVIQDCYSQ